MLPRSLKLEKLLRRAEAQALRRGVPIVTVVDVEMALREQKDSREDIQDPAESDFWEQTLPFN